MAKFYLQEKLSTTQMATVNSGLVAADKTKIDGAIQSSEKGAANGVAPLNASKKVVDTYIDWSYVDNEFVQATQIGVANGVASLDSTGKVPAGQLPSFVDDVLEFDTKTQFPATGEAGKIYVAKDTNTSWRWGGTAYIQIKGDLALGTTSSTAYRGDRGQTAYTHSQTTGNPHGTTVEDIAYDDGAGIDTLGDMLAWLKNNFSSYVPTTRTINGNALSSNITLNLDNINDGTTYKRVTQSNINTWNAKQDALGFTPENPANKVSSISSTSTNTQYPGAKAVYDAIQSAVGGKIAHDDGGWYINY